MNFWSIFVVSLVLIGSALALDCNINGCTYDTAQINVDVIEFNSTGYFPSCIRVASGTNVTFNGNFTEYNLNGGYFSKQ